MSSSLLRPVRIPAHRTTYPQSSGTQPDVILREDGGKLLREDHGDTLREGGTHPNSEE